MRGIQYTQTARARHRALLRPALLAVIAFAAGGPQAHATVCEIAFAEQTGAANPFDGIGFGLVNKSLNLADLDGDGDLDMVFTGGDPILQPGGGNTVFLYLKNVGNAASPSFVIQSAANNPLNFNSPDSEFRSAVADFDDDGDLDAMYTTGASTTIAYFENTGGKTNPVFVQQTGAANPFDGINAGINPTPSPVDIDGDGDVDLFFGEMFLKNTGSPGAPAFVLQAAVDSPSNGLGLSTTDQMAFFDADKDGDFDMVAGNASPLRYFENTGTFENAVFAERTGVNNPLDGITATFLVPVTGDLNNDGKVDVVAGTASTTLTYIENQSTRTLTTYAVQAGLVPPPPFATSEDEGTEIVSVVDIDGDNDFDLFTGFVDGTPVKALIGHRVLYYENTGDAGTPNFVLRDDASNPLAIAAGGLNTPFPRLADLDGDGDFDAVLGRLNGAIGYLQNNGTATVPSFGGGVNPFSGFNVGSRAIPDLYDLDDDGDLDAVVGEGTGVFNYFENTGDKFSPVFAERTGADNPFEGLDAGDYSTPTLYDIDGDGDADMFSGVGATDTRYYENIGSPKAPRFVQRTGGGNPLDFVNPADSGGPVFADLDNDGDDDFFVPIVPNNSGVITFFEATVTPCPVIANCQDITVDLDDAGNATITAAEIDNGSTANTGIVSLDLDIDTFTCDDLGPNTVTLTVTATGGGTDDCTATVTVQDVTPPLITLNGDSAVTLQCGEIYIEAGALGSDACVMDLPEVSIGGDVVDTGSPGEYIVTYDLSTIFGISADQVMRTVTVLNNCDTLSVDGGGGMLNATAGEAVTLEVDILNANGSINDIQWYYDDGSKTVTPVVNGGSFSGANSTALLIDPVDFGHAGEYHCEVTDDFDTAASSPFTLVVSAALSLSSSLGLGALSSLFALAGAAFARRRKQARD